jgi:hypothetical protein
MAIPVHRKQNQWISAERMDEEKRTLIRSIPGSNPTPSPRTGTTRNDPALA